MMIQTITSKFIPYGEQYRYIAPARPFHKPLPPESLSKFERDGWWAQVKKNGINSVIFVSPDKDLIAMNRYGEGHKNWEWTFSTAAIFKTLPGKGWYAINAELLHKKVTGQRDIHYLHDLLVEDGQYLVGSTYAYRYQRLQSLFFKGTEPKQGEQSHWVLDDHTWFARNIRKDFRQVFDGLTKPEDEGLVLKNPQGILSLKESENARWAVKSRKPHANFGF
jgi:hypothetical protein